MQEERRGREILLLGIYNTILSTGQMCLPDVTRLHTLMNVRTRATLNSFQDTHLGNCHFEKQEMFHVCAVHLIFRDCQSQETLTVSLQQRIVIPLVLNNVWNLWLQWAVFQSSRAVTIGTLMGKGQWLRSWQTLKQPKSPIDIEVPTKQSLACSIIFS